jgi:hypothetical protein
MHFQVYIFGGEGYENVGSLGLGDRAFDPYVIYFSVVVLVLLLGIGVSIRAIGDCKNCVVS